jgi:hypothetical protein
MQASWQALLRTPRPGLERLYNPETLVAGLAEEYSNISTFEAESHVA